jgi:hypothetical protein
MRVNQLYGTWIERIRNSAQTSGMCRAMRNGLKSVQIRRRVAMLQRAGSRLRVFVG